jgi:hypothetical protein
MDMEVTRYRNTCFFTPWGAIDDDGHGLMIALWLRV